LIEPATVPANTRTGDGKIATVLFAATLNETVLEPVENITNGSSVAPTALGVNDNVSVPESGAGYGADKAKAIGCCCVGFNWLGTPVNVSDGKLVGLTIVSEKA
jgi:hypothetical protein